MSECVNVLFLLLSLSGLGLPGREKGQKVACLPCRLSLCRLGKCNVAIAITTPAIAMTITLCVDATITVYREKSVPLLPASSPAPPPPELVHHRRDKSAPNWQPSILFRSMSDGVATLTHLLLPSPPTPLPLPPAFLSFCHLAVWPNPLNLAKQLSEPSRCFSATSLFVLLLPLRQLLCLLRLLLLLLPLRLTVVWPFLLTYLIENAVGQTHGDRMHRLIMIAERVHIP